MQRDAPRSASCICAALALYISLANGASPAEHWVGAWGFPPTSAPVSGNGNTSVQALPNVARSHHAVAQAVALGAADAGVATRSAAAAFGLHFVPLTEDRFDLCIPQPLLEDERILALLDTLRSDAFRRELGALGGYGVSRTGRIV